VQRGIDAHDVGEAGDAVAEPSDTGGEAACLAHLVCSECGVVLDGSAHRDGCAAATQPPPNGRAS